MEHIKKQDVGCLSQRWESHAGVFTHMFASSCNVSFLIQTLAWFWTPISVLPEDNSPDSVLIPKVITFGALKINFPFLHSVWVMLGDKACSRRQQKTERGCCCQNEPFWLPSVYQRQRVNCANLLYEIVGVIVWPCICTTKSLVVIVCRNVRTNPHASCVESDFLNTLLFGAKSMQWTWKRVSCMWLWV